MTTLTLLDASGQLITNVDVRVAADVTRIQGTSAPDPARRDRSKCAPPMTASCLSGIVSSHARLQRALDLAERYAPERVSNLMSVGGIQQVMLKVRFAEMQRSVSKSLSSSLALNGALGGDLGINGGTGTTDNVRRHCKFSWRQHPGHATRTRARFFSASTPARSRSASCWKRLEQKGVVRTLAEPNLVALSGQEAKFLAGGEYPVPVAQEDGADHGRIQTFRGRAELYPPCGGQGSHQP